MVVIRDWTVHRRYHGINKNLFLEPGPNLTLPKSGQFGGGDAHQSGSLSHARKSTVGSLLLCAQWLLLADIEHRGPGKEIVAANPRPTLMLV